MSYKYGLNLIVSVPVFLPSIAEVPFTERLGGDSLFPLRLRERVDPYPFLDIRLINERQYNVKDKVHHPRAFSCCIFVPLDTCQRQRQRHQSSFLIHMRAPPATFSDSQGRTKLLDRLPRVHRPKGKSPLSIFTIKVSVPSDMAEREARPRLRRKEFQVSTIFFLRPI